jgi:hypothetical protein
MAILNNAINYAYPEKAQLAEKQDSDYNQKQSENIYPSMNEQFSKLPILIQNAVNPNNANNAKMPTEQFIVLYSSLIMAGVCTGDAWINYDNRRNYLNLMLMVVLPPGSGKGILGPTLKLIEPINDKVLRESNIAKQEYKRQNAAYQSLQPAERQRQAEPIKPSQKAILVPGNVSSAKLIDLLHRSGGKYSLIFCETEMDTLGISAKSEFGLHNSTILRQAFHHEQISKAIKKDDEYLIVKNPRLSVILAGTPNQAVKLLHNNADGLVSRFLVIHEDIPPVWKNTKPCDNCIPLEDHFQRIGEEYLQMWEFFKGKEIEIRFTDKQWEDLNTLGESIFGKVYHFKGESAGSIIKRHMLMLFRLAGILTMIREYEKKGNATLIVCQDDDFEIAKWLTKYSIQGSLRLYENLPGEKSEQEKASKKMIFIQKLPETFTTKDACIVGNQTGIPLRTVYRCLHEFVQAGILEKTNHGAYKKINNGSLAV